jgi:6-phosphofructokinase 1
MPFTKPFFSYKFADQKFIEWVYFLLSKQGIEPFYWPIHGRAGSLPGLLAQQIDECDSMVAFLGTKGGGTQGQEISYFLGNQNGRPFVPVQLVKTLPSDTSFVVAGMGVTPAEGTDYDSARRLAEKIVPLLGLTWAPEDGLPNSYVVDNEKEFLDKFRKKDEALLLKLRTKCGWTIWPSIEKKEARLPNPIADESIGTLSDGSHKVLLDARESARVEGEEDLTLPEARPRTKLRYPLQRGGVFKVGILVSGGIAPGINAVIDGIVTRHYLYSRQQVGTGMGHALQILGYREGFKALLRNGVPAQRLQDESLRQFVEAAGSHLGTSRADTMLPGKDGNRSAILHDAVARLQTDGIHILYVIGGDGSMSCAHALWHYAKSIDYDLSVVGIPKAMDNDILWVWQSFGFLSAVEEARQAILHLHTEVASNPRVGIIQLFGSDSGFIASHAGYSTACDLVLIPEDPLTMKQIADHVIDKLTLTFGNGQNNAGPYAMVVMAETALPKDARDYIKNPHADLSEDEQRELNIFLDNGRRVRGQTPDALRRAGLKIVSGVLQERIRAEMQPTEYWRDFRVITNEPRHLIRSIPPSVTDVIFGERLGALAVDNAMAGYTDFMVSQWLTEFVLVPLPLVVLGRKRVPTNGIFWKSVLSKTGQPTQPPAKESVP